MPLDSAEVEVARQLITDKLKAEFNHPASVAIKSYDDFLDKVVQVSGVIHTIRIEDENGQGQHIIKVSNVRVGDVPKAAHYCRRTERTYVISV